MAFMDDSTPMLMDPGIAMAFQGLENMGNLRRGQPTVSPIKVYQDMIAERAQMNQQQKLGRFRDLQMKKAERDLATPVVPESKVVEGVLYERGPTGEWTAKTEEKGGDIFEGSGMNQQAYNALYGGEFSPDSPQYRAAYDALYGLETRIDPTTGQAYQIQKNAPAGLPAPPGYDVSGQGPAPKPLSVDQSKNRGFWRSASDAQESMQALEDTDFRMSTKAIEAFMRDPSATKAVFRAIASPQEQQYMNAMQTLLTAKLRKESGAAISTEEWASGFRELLPIQGESEDLYKQKYKNRRNIVSGFYDSAGRFEDAEKEAWGKRQSMWDEGFSPTENTDPPLVLKSSGTNQDITDPSGW